MASDNGIVGRNSWRAVVVSRVEALEAELTVLPTESRRDAATVEQIRKLLDEARRTAVSRDRRIRAWWTGSAIEFAWRSVHAAEVLLAGEQPIELIRARYPAALENARHLLRAGDPRQTAVQRWLGQRAQSGSVTPTDERARYATCLHWINAESDNAFSRVRSFRNILIVVAIAMSVVAGGFVVVGMWYPDAIPVCVEVVAGEPIVADSTGDDGTGNDEAPGAATICPTGGDAPRRGDVPLVALVGLVGASLATAVAIRKLRGTQTPYSVPLAMSMLKLPTGAVTSIAGVMLVQGDFVPGLSALDTQAQVLSYALIFGYAQEAFTRLVDRQGEQVLTNAPGPDRVTSGREQPEAVGAPAEPPAPPQPPGTPDGPSDHPHDEPLDADQATTEPAPPQPPGTPDGPSDHPHDEPLDADQGLGLPPDRA
jgi:hypothetical protein